jgi:ABC-type polysaccharide/polyol phosphate transport system ATPase subunit
MDNLQFVFQRGEQLGIVGKNGLGNRQLNLLTRLLPLDYK